MQPTNKNHLTLYTTFFRGRADVYARRWEKADKSGYSPAYSFSWDEFFAHKSKGGTMATFDNKRLQPLTDAVLEKHIIGTEVIGIYPILSDNTSYFIAADFDGENWGRDAVAYHIECEKNNLRAYIERSRSGNGAHVWIFFADAYPCYKSRQIALELLRRSLHISEFAHVDSFDRLFPNQDILTKRGFGNLIAIPLQGSSLQKGNSAFVDPIHLQLYDDQWAFLETIHKHTIAELDAVHAALLAHTPTLVKNTTTGVITITVDNKIRLHRSDVPADVVAFLKEKLHFANTEFVIKQAMGKPTYQTERYFKLIEESGDEVALPRGFLINLIAFLDENSHKYEVAYKHAQLESISFKNNITLTESQKTAVDTCDSTDSGVLIAPPGSGKTIMALELIARKKQPALILVHRRELLEQWVERIQQFLGIPKTHIGAFSSTKKKVGKHITVALMQTLARKEDLKKLADTFGTIIVDECHHIPANTFREVVTTFNPKHLYGLTATPTRKYNDENLIYFHIGPIIARMEAQNLQEVTESQICEVHAQKTNITLPFSFKTDKFALLANILCFDTGRNSLIVADITRLVRDNKKVLVLSERKEHLEVLALYLKGICETTIITGDDSVRSRKIKMKQLKSGHAQVILSTGQFFGEGMDVQGITALVLAFPFSFHGKLTQYIGRMRGADQKQIIDYNDAQIPILARQYVARKKYYRKQGFAISD
jgi:superfamily II DNA or RNA helicase